MYVYDAHYSWSPRPARAALGEFGGPLGRQQVTDATKAPYRWICALDVHFPSGGKTVASRIRGTGVLISPRHVLTAAKNVVQVARTIESNRTSSTRVDAQRVTVTPGLDGSKLIGKSRAPVGSIDLKPGDWWVPGEYRPEAVSGFYPWNVAVLTLPKELPPFRGMSYGHWSDTRYAPRTTIEPATGSSLTGATVSVAGYPLGTCTQEGCTPCQWSTDKAGPIPIGKRPKQWELFAKVQPMERPLEHEHVMLYDAGTCDGMSGAPVWLKTGGLRLVAIHLVTHLHHLSVDTGRPEALDIALPLRADLLNIVRKRIAGDRIRPSF